MLRDFCFLLWFIPPTNIVDEDCCEIYLKYLPNSSTRRARVVSETKQGAYKNSTRNVPRSIDMIIAEEPTRSSLIHSPPAELPIFFNNQDLPSSWVMLSALVRS